MDRHYVSEFTRFINGYLDGHPEVVKDQKLGWNIYWDHRADFQAIEEARTDSVPDDGYGFHNVDIRKDHH